MENVEFLWKLFPYLEDGMELNDDKILTLIGDGIVNCNMRVRLLYYKDLFDKKYRNCVMNRIIRH